MNLGVYRIRLTNPKTWNDSTLEEQNRVIKILTPSPRVTAPIAKARVFF